MKLTEILANEFEKSLRSVFEFEVKHKWFLPSFLGAKLRAWLGLTIAFIICLPRMTTIGALAIQNHRQDIHNENKSKSIEKLSRGLTGETVEKVSSSQAWLV